jgi:tetratricopeptide (TPR) repeat protein
MRSPGSLKGRLLTGLLATGCGLLSAACSVNPPVDLSAVVDADSEAVVRLSSVPFFPQAEFECGPAALAGVLGATGVETTAELLSEQVYLPGRQGSLQAELLAASRRAGRIPYVIDGTPEALVAQLTAGRPVLVLQNLRTRHFPVWHYAVLVGFDSVSNRFYLNSGEHQGLDMAAPAFLRSWDWSGRWAVVVLRPGELPAGADSLRYIEAVADFEVLAAPAAARPAWLAALEQWPDNPLPYLALGNAAYDGGDLRAAVGYYRRGLGISAMQPALNNNLASVLGELGCPRAGEALLGGVVADLAADSPWRATMAATLEELAARAGTDPEFCGSFSAGF